MDAIDEAYQNLANAIIIRAVKDFRRCLKVAKKNNRNKEAAIKEMKEIVEFIKSPWFRTLTSLEPSVLLKKLQHRGKKFFFPVRR